MDRQKPDTTTNEIDLYIRTYYSLLRSSGEIRVRSLEEVHSYSQSSLHVGARSPEPDLAAFGYAAARLPGCMPRVERVILGQSLETFESFGYPVRDWVRVETRGRRRPLRYDGSSTLAAFVASSSDIDDLIPILCAYQIEWNKLHARALSDRQGLGLSDADRARLREALGVNAGDPFVDCMERRLDLRVRLLAGAFSEYQRAAQRWWSAIEQRYVSGDRSPRPVYFVSSNTHALANLLGGYALAHSEALGARDANDLYFRLREHLKDDPRMLEPVLAWDREGGIESIRNRAQVEVDAQRIEIARLRPERFDPRLQMSGLDALARSDAVVLNIDYPLGMAAYHLLSRVGQGVGPLLGVYVMGKAATLNAQVGDVMISRVVHDEHSQNTYLFRNAFSADDVSPYLVHGTVLDNQKAVTVRGPFLQNPRYMNVFYREGYSVLEMESGPYLSAVYEHVDPRRHPNDELVELSDRCTVELGILHYASDTPISRRQALLSKSLGAFGMDATYACATAITRRILERELERIAAQRAR
ncbi:MAG: hypothetical protein ACE5IL_01340 [Myxococcota bacterium]